MNKMLESWLRTFLAASAAVALVQLQNGDVLDLNAILTAGAVAVLPVIQRYLNPNDTAFGRGAK